MYIYRRIGQERYFPNKTLDFVIEYMEKFYYDEQFNLLYRQWKSHGEPRFLRPSLDHIIPKAQGGEVVNINNLQFLTWLENKCKSDIPQNEWDKMKSEINLYFLNVKIVKAKKIII